MNIHFTHILYYFCVPVVLLSLRCVSFSSLHVVQCSVQLLLCGVDFSLFHTHITRYIHCYYIIYGLFLYWNYLIHKKEYNDNPHIVERENKKCVLWWKYMNNCIYICICMYEYINLFLSSMFKISFYQSIKIIVICDKYTT